MITASCVPGYQSYTVAKMLILLLLILTTSWSQCMVSAEDICQLCDCLPSGDKPAQAFCVDKGNSDEVLSLSTSLFSSSLQLVYISGMKKVIFKQDSFVTIEPFDLLIQDCSEVYIYNHSINSLRSLTMQNLKKARVEAISYLELWSVVLKNMDQLMIDEAGFKGLYFVTIGGIKSLTVLQSQDKTSFYNLDLKFTLFGSVMNSILNGGLTVFGNLVKLENNTFKSVAEGGLQIIAERKIQITNNNFEYLEKKVFNLTSPEINISGNYFDTLPAGALSEVSTIQDTFFTNNTIRDVDLGGVLLDMGWDINMEGNLIDCDCASKRTSILNPKKDMLILTNSSYEALDSIFVNNYCSLNCTVTLKTFSYALIQREICLTNITPLEQEKLCDIYTLPDDVSETETEQSFISAVKRVEYLVPLSVVFGTILLTCLVWYGCREMNSFKFVFNPHGNLVPKPPSE